MEIAFIQKLMAANGRRDAFTAEDRALLLTVCDDVREYRSRRDIIREGDKPTHVLVIIEGFACRYKVLPAGSRQITAFLIPGDFCDTHITMFGAMDHSIATMSDSKVAMLSREAMEDIAIRPRIARALWWATLVDEAVLRSWIVNLGRRDAFDRVGHLICELHARLRNVGRVEKDAFRLPISQEEFADALGLTPVHVNQTLKRLRDEGLATFRHREIVIHDIAGLQKAVGFDPDYLQLTRDEAGLYSGESAFVRDKASPE